MLREPCHGPFKESGGGSILDVLVGPGDESRGAQGEEDQVGIAEVGNALWTARGDKHQVSGAEDLRGQIANLDPPLA